MRKKKTNLQTNSTVRKIIFFAIYLFVFLSAGMLSAAPLRVFIEAEDMKGSSDAPWQVLNSKQLWQKGAVRETTITTSGGSAVYYPKGEKITDGLTFKLPRSLKIGEDIKIYVRTVYPVDGQPSTYLEANAGGTSVEWEITGTSHPHIGVGWRWTEGKILKAAVAGDTITLRVSNPSNDTFIDTVYITGYPDEPDPQLVFEGEGYTVGQIDKRLKMPDNVDIANGLTFYADFEGTAKPLFARGSDDSMFGGWTGPDIRYAPGRAGQGLLAKEKEGNKHGYSNRDNFPYKTGTLSLWFKPDWDSSTPLADNSHRNLLTLRPTSTYFFVDRTTLRSLFGVPNYRKDRWYHVITVWDEKSGTMYLDGSPVFSAPEYSFWKEDISQEAFAAGSFHIGGYKGVWCLDGVIDEFALWDRKLDAEEIRLLFLKGLAGETFLPAAYAGQLRQARGIEPGKVSIAKANLLKNGSFEAGLSDEARVAVAVRSPFARLTVPKFQPEIAGVVEDDAYHGKRSLRLNIPARQTAALTTLAFKVEEGAEYNVSAWVKLTSAQELDAKALIELDACFSPVKERGSKTPQELRKKERLHPDSQWRQISFGVVPKGSVDSLYFFYLQAINRTDVPVTLSVDALCISGGKLPENGYAFNYPIAWTVTGEYAGNIIKKGSPVRLKVSSANEGAEAMEETVTLRVYDFWGKEIYSVSVSRRLAAGEIKEELLTVPLDKTGVFRVLLERGNGAIEDEVPFSVIPEGRFAAAGGHYHPDAYSQMIARQLGVTWNRDWDNSGATCWYQLQKSGDEPFDWSYSDPIIKTYKESKMDVLGVLDTRWTWIGKEMGPPHQKLLSSPEYLSRWKDYVEKVVARYRKEITHWEFLNEPYSEWKAEDYIKLLKETIPVIKKSNPDAVIVGPCSHSAGEWLKRLIDLGLLDLIDVGSYHGHAQRSESVRAVVDLLKKDGKVNTVFDTENSAGWGDSFFCRSWQGRQFSGSGTYDKVAATMARSFLLSRGEGVDVYFHYWSPPYEAYQNYPSFIGHTGYLKPRGVAFAIASWLTDGYEPQEKFMLGNYVRCYIFARGKEKIATLWDERAGEAVSTVSIPGDGSGLTFLDIMGNPDVKIQKTGDSLGFEVTGTPVYVKTAGDLSSILKETKVKNIGLESFVATATLTSVDGKLGILLDLYNNDTVKKEGTAKTTGMPDGCSFEKGSLSFALENNQSAELFFPLRQVSDSIRRGTFRWEVVSSDGVRQDIEAELSMLAAPRTKGIVVDGDLKEWRDTPKVYINQQEQVVVGIPNWQGKKDVSGWTAVQWDTDYLYVAINVTDDNYIPPKRVTYNTDAAEIFLDLDLVGTRNLTSRTPDVVQIVVGLNDRGEFDCLPKVYKHLKGTGKKTAEGYSLEVVFPLKEAGIEGRQGLTIGFDVALDDGDTPGRGRKLQIVWAGTKANFNNPKNYGQIYFK